MAGLSYPFDSGPGSTISEDQWSYLMRDAVGTGVHEAGTSPGPNSQELRVFSLDEPGIIHVQPGRASLNGFHYQQGGAEILAVTANANATQDRIDAVVLRLDLDTNTIAMEVKLGSPSGTPVPPAITSSELLLATFRVRKSSNTVLSNEVTDARTFVGRRMSVSNQGGTGREGDIRYAPGANRWFGVMAGGSAESFAFQSELTAHKNASDPHPQYLTAAEGTPTFSWSNLTRSPLFENYNCAIRSLDFPGGFKIVWLQVWGVWTGVTQTTPFTILTIDNPALRPNWTVHVPGVQYLYSNSTDDIPLTAYIEPSGAIGSAYNTYIMGGATMMFSAVWIKGPGV